MTTGMLFRIDEEKGVVGVNLQRCSKNPLTTKGFVHSVGNFNVAKELNLHLKGLPVNGGRLWWQPNTPRTKLVQQPMGKSQCSKIAKKIAELFEKDPSNYGSHSFRRSGATAMANAGATYDQIMLAGGWTSVNVARKYIEESDRSAEVRAKLLQFKWSPSSTVSSETAPKVVSSETAPKVEPLPEEKPLSSSSTPVSTASSVFSGCSFSGVSFTPEFLVALSKCFKP